MDAKDARRSSDGPTNEQTSFGSNCLPHSQSQNKISIGVLAEPTQKLNSGVKDDEPAFTSARNEAQCRNLLEENFKQTATKYLPGETAQVLQKNSYTDEQSNDISSQQSRKKAKNNMEKNEQLAGAKVRGSNELNKEKQGKRAAAQRSNQTLRMKLSEILETASSPTKRSVSFETPSKVEKGLKLEGHFHQNNIKAANSRLDTDTIENDYVAPNADETKRRPVTRLLMKKEATNKPMSVRMTNHAIGNRGDLPNSSIGGSGRGRGLKRKNIFSFSEEIWSQNIIVASDINTSTMIYKKGERNNSGLDQEKNCAFHAEKREREKTELPAQKPSAHGRAGNSYDHLSRDEQKDLHPMNGVVKEIHNSPARKKKYQKDVNGSELPGEAGLQEGLHCFSLKNNEEIHFEDNNQQMGVETPIQNQNQNQNHSPLCLSAARRKQSEHGAHSPAATEKQPEGKDLSSSRTFWNSKASSFRFDVEPESSDGFEEFKTPTIRKSPSDEEEKLSDGMPKSSAEHDIDSFEEDHAIKKEPKPARTPESDDYETSLFLLRSTKTPHGQGAVRTKEFSSPLPSLKEFAGTPQSNGREGPSDAQNGDSLARAVALFASALERVRTKMKLLVIKKSAEVLESVAEETKLQLQNVESQIATDIEKFTLLGESKRKTLEKKFQEQQECLRVMYERFKEDMNKHYEDRQTTLEELEIYQREQKGGAGKLKSLHKKLLLQVEEGIGSQISDAERRILMVQKVAQHKMLQLRHVVMEFLSKDD